MAKHYGVAVVPARPAKPHDKAKVESAVLVVQRWILARLRNRQFWDLGKLNEAIAELVEELNNRPFQKKLGLLIDREWSDRKKSSSRSSCARGASWSQSRARRCRV